MAIKYTEGENSVGQVIIHRDNGDGTTSTIPSDPANSDYQRYLAWLENPEAEHLNGSVHDLS
jgi:hypothetical protein